MQTSAVSTMGSVSALDPVDESKLVLDLHEHGICFSLPRGGIMNGNIELPGGAIISGKFRGRISSKTGSIIFAKGSEFIGTAEADCIYVEGSVNPVSVKEPSILTGRMLIAISENASGKATLRSASFAINASRFGGDIEPVGLKK